MKFSGELLGDKIVIFNLDEAKALYQMGFYGKPLTISKPKSVKDINKPLELSLLEGLYLSEQGLLEVRHLGDIWDVTRLESYATSIVTKFRPLYLVYKDLKRRGFIVRSGIKFGSDFAIYTLGPGVEHAPFVVSVIDSSERLSVNELMSYGRVSHSTRKKLVLAIVNTQLSEIKYIMFKWVKL
ncbi:tRNA-intron lyase [Metallosphaera javensis (ex Sakai et al. 2022)]|uniref:tRNA-intron lyase n=1 Tax=Metallosphaera TaxID=41980 RepID=UPI003CE5A2D5